MFGLLEHISYLGIFLVLVITGTGFPLPEEVPVIIAGVASRTGALVPFWAFLACLSGALLGDLVMYTIGYHFGRGVLFEHRFLARHLTPEREQRIESMINRHGFKVFLVSRFLVGLRSPVFLSAGSLCGPVRKVILFDALCSTLVVGFFFSLSYAFGEQIHQWWRYIRGAEYALTGLFVAVGVGLLIYYLVRMRRRRARLLTLRSERLARLSRAAKETLRKKKTAM